jgi:hypothetical protein
LNEDKLDLEDGPHPRRARVTGITATVAGRAKTFLIDRLLTGCKQCTGLFAFVKK